MMGFSCDLLTSTDGPIVNPQYQAPKKLWVGLTEQEIDKAIPYKDLSGDYSYDDIVNIVLYVQAKLKEKNHG